MPHDASPLDLLRYRYHAFECEADESEDPQGELSLTTEQKLACDADNPLSWHVSLTINFKPVDDEKPTTYRGKIQISGEFQIHESFKEENREALIRVTATSMLYGACREMLANFTARSLHGCLSLPSISFRKKKENG